MPHHLRGDQIELVARLVNLADVLEVFHRADSVNAACDVARQRRGTQFDPAVAAAFKDIDLAAYDAQLARQCSESGVTMAKAA